MEEGNLSDIFHIVGIDRGINFVIATYDSKHKSGFVNGKQIKQKRTHYLKLRKEQAKIKNNRSTRKPLDAGYQPSGIEGTR